MSAKSLQINSPVICIPKSKDCPAKYEFAGRIIGFKGDLVQVIDKTENVFDMEQNEVMGYEDY